MGHGTPHEEKAYLLWDWGEARLERIPQVLCTAAEMPWLGPQTTGGCALRTPSGWTGCCQGAYLWQDLHGPLLRVPQVLPL